MLTMTRQRTPGYAAAPHGTNTPAAVEKLIPHILSRYHDTHRTQLPDLIRRAWRVEEMNGDHPACPFGLALFLEELAGELYDHMMKEEQVLFPMLLARHPMAAMPIARMRDEHVDHNERLALMTDLCGGFTVPVDAGDDWRALIEGCAKLHADLRAHIALENDVLFPQFEPSASPAGFDEAH